MSRKYGGYNPVNGGYNPVRGAEEAHSRGKELAKRFEEKWASGQQIEAEGKLLGSIRPVCACIAPNDIRGEHRTELIPRVSEFEIVRLHEKLAKKDRELKQLEEEVKRLRKVLHGTGAVTFDIIGVSQQLTGRDFGSKVATVILEGSEVSGYERDRLVSDLHEFFSELYDGAKVRRV